MDNNPCCFPEPEERYTGLILRAHPMQAEEKQAGAKFSLLKKLKWTRKEQMSTNRPGEGLGFWTDRRLYATTVRLWSGQETEGGNVQTHTFANIFSVFLQ
ncbi:hypothetical protein ILYODFUR_030739 [Ilyodon furcidens]|uniref:Uncharacterized protein n=1 Tax=Ilyodon furcidens TaxID=33524 RepID=A0ABV0VIJ2_9TELE